MDIKLGLHQGLHLKQQLVMTQRLQQALKLLQVPTLELEQILRQELQANPLLEEVDPAEETDEEVAAEEPIEEAADDEEGDSEDGSPIDYDEYFNDGFRAAVSMEQDYDEDDQIERPAVFVPSGQQSLEEQLMLATDDETDRRIGQYIIGCLNEDGYMVCSLREVAAFCETDEARVERVLRIIQDFDPPGVGARDLQECLLLQLRARGREDSPEAFVVHHHFDALKNRKFGDIAREMKITTREVQEIAERIGELDPKPGLSTTPEGARPVVPDLVVEKVDEDYVVYLNDGNLPRLRVSEEYQSLKRRAGDSDAVQFIDEKRRYAEWIIKTIEQRRRTMIKVMEAIVAEQRDFFEQGAIALRPLTLQQVAGAIGMHESTVSRVTRQKYVQTPRGVFPLKYFFSAGLDTEEGDEIAAKAVKLMIQEIVAGEDPGRPLSDKKIVDLLSQRGLKIARRTVAKYREQLGILNARMRKQYS
jgi:RNA polymerase sigma-54 factor